MLERYTDDARKVIFFARYEASRLGSPALQTEHIWLGLLRQNKRLIRRLASHVTLETIHERIIRHGVNAERISMTAEIPLSAELTQVLAAAQAESDHRKQLYITSEHLVNALLMQEDPNP